MSMTAGTAGPPAWPVPPRLVALTHDVWDDAGNAVGWQIVAWGVLLPGGTAVTMPFGGPASAAVWLTLDDACTAMDGAQVCEVRPRPYAQWWRDRRP
jgi:hypothetical protein